MQERATLPVGMVIQGRYLVEGVLGTGCCGATYLVRKRRARGAAGELFVLKEGVESRRPARRRLRSAGRRLKSLHHAGLPRVRRVMGGGRHHGVCLLVDYVEGQNLETLRQQQPGQRLAWSQVMSILSPVVEALTFLHRQKTPVVHGDVKPANIIVQNESGRVLLVGIGVTTACGRAGVDTAAGLSRYRAPEQYGGIVDVRADVYGLGATFYALATGTLPPDARSRLARDGDFLQPAAGLAPVIPLHVAAAIDRALALDPRRRFSSVEQFWEALWRLEEHPMPAFGAPFLREGPPTVPLQAAVQGADRPAREPPPAGPVPASPAEQAEDPTPTVPLPRKPERYRRADQAEERQDPDATVRLPPLPPGVRRPSRPEGQSDPNARKPPGPSPDASASAEGKENPATGTPSPAPSDEARSTISFRKLDRF